MLSLLLGLLPSTFRVLTPAYHMIADYFCRRTFTTWLVYVIGVMYIAMVLGTSGYNYFALFLKSIKRSDGSPRWTQEQVNLIPIGGSAINVVFGMSPCFSVFSFIGLILRSLDMGFLVRSLENKMDSNCGARYVRLIIQSFMLPANKQ